AVAGRAGQQSPARHPDPGARPTPAGAQAVAAPPAGQPAPGADRRRRLPRAGCARRLVAPRRRDRRGRRLQLPRRGRPGQPGGPPHRPRTGAVPRHRPAAHRRPPQPGNRGRPRLPQRQHRHPPRRPGPAGPGRRDPPLNRGTTMSYIRSLAGRAREASHAVAALDPERRAALLRAMATSVDSGRAGILAANAADMQRAGAAGTTGAMLDRLMLDDGRIDGIEQAINEIAALPDPVGQVTRSETHANGMTVAKVRIPLGLIAMIYEARPNVTADAAALCLRAGNAVLLRGGSEARESNVAIA